MPSDRSHGLSEPVLALRAAARPRPAVRDRRGRRHRSAAPLPTAFPVVVAVMMFNFIGDGLRDAADPYAA